MKRSPLTRKAPLRRTAGVNPKRSTPRRREAPRWDSEDWAQGNLILMARAGSACERCGHGDRGIERHHRKRRRDGGESFPNLTALCPACHRWCHEHPALARKYGWIVPVHLDPVTVPMLWRSKEWVLLTADGGLVPAFAVDENLAAPTG